VRGRIISRRGKKEAFAYRPQRDDGKARDSFRQEVSLRGYGTEGKASEIEQKSGKPSTKGSVKKGLKAWLCGEVARMEKKPGMTGMSGE